jgi:hypothetical protein
MAGKTTENKTSVKAATTVNSATRTSKRVGQILLSKGGRKYIKLEQDINKDDILFLNKPSEEIDFLVESGRITEQEGRARKEKVPDFVLANLVKGVVAKNTNAESF